MAQRRPAADRDLSGAAATKLALAAGAGDRAALGEFIRVTHGDVWRFLAHLTDADSADDLTQETYIKVIDGLSSFRGEAPVRSWLFTIARRTAVDHIRRENARPKGAATLAWMAEGFAGVGQPDASGLVVVRRMLASLDEDRRVALVLTTLFGLSYAEAAQVMGVALGTIRSRVARARAQLVAEWSDDVACLDDVAMQLVG